jgi:hypothetical protein
MIKERDTQLVLAPSSPRAPMTAIVVGSDNDFEMEKQLAENMTRVHFYGVNLHSMESVAHFKRRLNGTILHKHLHTAEENEKEGKMIWESGYLFIVLDSTKLVPARFFDKYFPRRPVDVVFLHLNHTSQNFIDQLMGNGKNNL